ncbi:hypothetical protein SDJN02_10634, partial [Cucurbita argyrosperma subsp. argyrosperma]
MAAEAPSWADQWGAGGIGAIEEDDGSKAKGEHISDKKARSKPGFAKAKAATVAGAKKIGSGISNGIKWIMNPRKKNSN